MAEYHRYFPGVATSVSTAFLDKSSIVVYYFECFILLETKRVAQCTVTIGYPNTKNAKNGTVRQGAALHFTPPFLEEEWVSSGFSHALFSRKCKYE